MEYALWLSNIPGIAGGKIRFLFRECCCAREVYELTKEQLLRIYGITEADAERIIDSKAAWDLEKEWMALAGRGIGFVSMEQEEYPKRLRSMVSPPYSLYYLGRLPEEGKKAVAIVGARKRSAYGCEAAEQLAKALAGQDVAVISGLARGIDADGHRGALLGEGRTYAVLGCGVDVCYPKENRYLYEKIMDKGGIISEYPVGTGPNSRLFPARNRIISALSDCVVVIEAREKSGSLITADFAMEQGKDVYALPGRITDPLSRGCNMLIRQGAGMFLGVEDFLKEWNIFCGETEVQMDFRKKLLEKDELLVYSLLDFCPTDLGTMIEKTSFRITELLHILERLEQKGFVKESVPNYYVRTL